MDAKKLLVLIPAYNEEDNIGRVLDDLEAAGVYEVADVLVVNDASVDRTADIAEKKGCRVLTQIYNMGYGTALQVGYKYAVRRDYEHVIQMDADGQHDVCNIHSIYEALLKPDEDGLCPDIVIGSRFMGAGNDLVPTGIKLFAIKFFRILIRILTGLWVEDPTSGLQGLSRRTFLYYSQYEHFDDRYPDANMLTQMALLGCRIEEIPAIMHKRRVGTSMHSGLKPILYMFLMIITVIGVWFRYGVMKEDKGVLDAEFIRKK